eukprot:COSAG01_NODE_6975_length_3409_cov_484.537764_3_plen_176_part_00
MSIKHINGYDYGPLKMTACINCTKFAIGRGWKVILRDGFRKEPKPYWEHEQRRIAAARNEQQEDGVDCDQLGVGGDAGARTAPGLPQGSARPPWPRGGAGSLLRHAPLRAWHLHLPLITQESTGAPLGRPKSFNERLYQYQRANFLSHTRVHVLRSNPVPAANRFHMDFLTKNSC